MEQTVRATGGALMYTRWGSVACEVQWELNNLPHPDAYNHPFSSEPFDCFNIATPITMPYLT
jgi:hypothetical protein